MSTRTRAEFGKQELVAVLEQYALGEILRIDPLLKGSRKSPKLILTTAGGRYLLKRRAPNRSDVLKAAFSHAVQRHLVASGLPVPRLRTTADGRDTMVCRGGHIYEVFEYLPGAPFDFSVAAVEDAARVLGRFHAALDGYRPDYEPSRTGFHDNNGVRTSINGIPSAVSQHDSVAGQQAELLGTIARLFDAYDRASEAVEAESFGQWPVQVVHADWHPGNMLFLDGRVSGLIDFDSLRMLPRVTDVANGALQFSIVGGGDDPSRWPAGADETRLEHFLIAYDATVGLRPEEVRVIPHLMVEALVAEAVLPVAATGSFGRIEGFRFLRSILRKAEWLQAHGERLVSVVQ